MDPVIEAIAIFCGGTFFGAALYISLVQHPAALDVGGEFAARFFPPMYGRAAPMQIALAITGSLAGTAAWWVGDDFLWLGGAVVLFSVIPITLFFIMPINDRLLSDDADPGASETLDLLRQWGTRHWIRTIVSGIAFLAFLQAVASG